MNFFSFKFFFFKFYHYINFEREKKSRALTATQAHNFLSNDFHFHLICTAHGYLTSNFTFVCPSSIVWRFSSAHVIAGRHYRSPILAREHRVCCFYSLPHDLLGLTGVQLLMLVCGFFVVISHFRGQSWCCW
jgi:hypothetical protein